MGTAKVFSLRGREILCIQHDAPVSGLVGFNSDKSQLGSVSGTTTVRLWQWAAAFEGADKI